MGLMNASKQFQQMMEDRLKDVNEFATPFIDDKLIGTRAEEGEDLYEKHYKQVCQVMDILEKDKLVGDAKKVELFVREVKFCGNILGNGERKPEPGKLMAIEKWGIPKNITELRAFLGFTNYYSAYIRMYAEFVAKLQDKLKIPHSMGKKGSKHPVEWNEEEKEAFEEIKKRLCSSLVLQRVNPDKPFVLRVDASRYAVGGALEQLIDEDRKPTVQDVLDKKNCTSGMHVKEINQRSTELGTQGTGNVCHNFGSAKMGKVG